MDEQIQKYPEAIRYVGKLIYERGWDYFKQNKITRFQLNDDTILASVRGSWEHEYEVVVRISNGSVVDSDCTCPYWARCKHIAAVLIYFFYNGTNKIGDDRAVAAPDFSNIPERTILLKFDDKRSAIVDEFLNNVEEAASLDKVQSSDDRMYKLIFRLRKATTAIGTSVWQITPGVRLIKKDGTLGNVYGYSAGKKLSPHSNDEETILKKLFRAPEKAELLEYYLDAIISHPDIELDVFSQYKTIGVTRRTLSKIRVGFELARVDRDTPLFRAIYSIFSETDEPVVPVSASEYSLVRDGTWLACITDKGFLYYCEDDDLLGTILDGLREIREFRSTDIKEIKDSLDQKSDKKIEIVFNVRAVTITSPFPKNILEMERRFLGTLILRLFFDYQGIEIPYGGSDKVIFKSDEREKIAVIRRNQNFEREVFQNLRRLVGDQADSEYSFLDKNPGSLVIGRDLNTFLAETGISLMNSGFTLRIGKEKKLSGKSGRMSLTIKSGIDWFDVSVTYLDSDGNELPIHIDQQDAFRGLVKTADSYVLLEKDDIKKMQDLISLGVGQNGHMRVSKYNLGFIDEFYELVTNKSDVEITRLREMYGRLLNTSKLEEYPLPSAFAGTLRDYQRAGYNWLHFLRNSSLNGCLADDMGLGKTVQTLAMLQKLKEEKALGPSLLVVPVTTLANWENEIERFCSGIKFLRHAGPARSTVEAELSGYDIIIVSYQTLRNDHVLFSSMSFDYLILDESQNIKNASTKAYKAIRSLRALHKLTLTGTPVENSSIELWAMMEVLNPGMLRSIEDFKRRFARPIQEFSDSEAASRLRKIVHPFILRRKKEDVLKELPEKEIINLYVEMNEHQRIAYDEVKKDFRDRIKSKITIAGLKKTQVLVLEGLLRLRQMALFPTLVNEKYDKVESAKFDLLKEMLSDILSDDHKILIYSQFVNVLKIIEKYVKSQSIGYSYLDGSTLKRAQVIDKFQKDPLTRVFLLSLKAGGLGINLTAADYIILFDPWWNPAIEEQAFGRAHRIGQTKKVIGYKFIAKNTVEEKILSLQEKKQKIVKDIIAEDTSVFKYLDTAEIIGLFS